MTTPPDPFLPYTDLTLDELNAETEAAAGSPTEGAKLILALTELRVRLKSEGQDSYVYAHALSVYADAKLRISLQARVELLASQHEEAAEALAGILRYGKSGTPEGYIVAILLGEDGPWSRLECSRVDGVFRAKMKGTFQQLGMALSPRDGRPPTYGETRPVKWSARTTEDEERELLKLLKPGEKRADLTRRALLGLLDGGSHDAE